MDTLDRISKLEHTIKRLDTILETTFSIVIAAECHLAKEEIEEIIAELKADCDPSVFVSQILN